jgi:uncharacterized membrane protein YhiD involved in acid resistance
VNIFDLISSDLQFASWSDVVISILVAFALGMVVSWVYRWTHRGLSYSASFVHTLLLLSSITALVMMIIGNSIARAFSLVGALSIIRFRTPVKDTRDTAFVFFSLAIGMATGTGAYTIAVLGTVVISILVLVTHRLHVGELHGSDFLLRFRVETSSDGENAYQNIINKYLKQSTLVNMATVQQGSRMELAFSVTFRDSHKQQQFLRELNSIPQIEQAMLVAVDEGNE